MARCYSLIAILSFILTLTFTDVSIFTTPINFPLGFFGLKAYIQNLRPESIVVPPTSIVFDKSEMSLIFQSPMTVQGTADVGLTPSVLGTVPLDFTISGGINVTKDHAAADGCTSNSFTTQSCDLKATLSLLGFTNVDVNLCDSIGTAFVDGLQAPALENPPVLTSGSSKLQSSLFFRTLRTKSLLSSLIGGQYGASFVGDTAMRISFGLALPLQADVDTSVLATMSTGYQMLAKLLYSIYSTIRDALGLPNLDHFLTTTATDLTGENITIAVGDSGSFFQELAANNASLIFSTYLPKGTNLSFDIVVDDLKCNLFGIVCSIPKENGIRVINTRINGLGDADAVFYNVLGATVEALLNDVAGKVIATKWGSASGDRVYLRAI